MMKGIFGFIGRKSTRKVGCSRVPPLLQEFGRKPGNRLTDVMPVALDTLPAILGLHALKPLNERRRLVDFVSKTGLRFMERHRSQFFVRECFHRFVMVKSSMAFVPMK